MGETTPAIGMDETAACQPTTTYGQSKYTAEDLVLNSGLAQPVVLRLPLVYGPGVKGNLASWLRLVRRGWMPRLPETGNRRSLIHVADVAQAVVLALSTQAAARQVYIISETRAYSAGEIDTLLRLALGQATPRRSWPLTAWWILAGLGELAQRCGVSAPLDLDRYHKLFDSAYYPATKARRELGFVPQFDLAEGARQMALTQ
jgi:nucleoside-diphosphate-sugar epimerase